MDKLPQGNLEDSIDTTQIHGWLQEQLSITEYQLAYCVMEFVKQVPDAIESLKEYFEVKGQIRRREINEILNLKELFKVIQDSLVDGMPCDHVNEVLEATVNVVIWHRNQCVHKTCLF